MRQLVLVLAFFSVTTAFGQAHTASSMYLKKNKTQQLDSVYSKSGNLFNKLGHHGPAIENPWYGLRLYFNKKTAIDVYSKEQPGLELTEKKWYPSKKDQLNGWGADYYKVGNTVGLGGIKLWDGEEVTDLHPVSGRSARVVTTKDSSYIEMLSTGIPYRNTTTDVYIRITVYASKRVSKVEAWTGNGDQVQFVTGINYFDYLKVQNEETYIATWGLHPEDVAAEKIKVGAAIILNKNRASNMIDDGKQYLYIMPPSSKLSFYISTANEREEEIHTFDSFISTLEKYIAQHK